MFPWKGEIVPFFCRPFFCLKEWNRDHVLPIRNASFCRPSLGDPLLVRDQTASGHAHRSLGQNPSTPRKRGARQFEPRQRRSDNSPCREAWVARCTGHRKPRQGRQDAVTGVDVPYRPDIRPARILSPLPGLEGRDCLRPPTVHTVGYSLAAATAADMARFAWALSPTRQLPLKSRETTNAVPMAYSSSP